MGQQSSRNMNIEHGEMAKGNVEKDANPIKVQLQLAINTGEECFICMDGLEDPIILDCGHIQCLDCSVNLLHRGMPCAMCRSEIHNVHSFSKRCTEALEALSAYIIEDADSTEEISLQETGNSQVLRTFRGPFVPRVAVEIEAAEGIGEAPDAPLPAAEHLHFANRRRITLNRESSNINPRIRFSRHDLLTQAQRLQIQSERLQAEALQLQQRAAALRQQIEETTRSTIIRDIGMSGHRPFVRGLRMLGDDTYYRVDNLGAATPETEVGEETAAVGTLPV